MREIEFEILLNGKAIGYEKFTEYSGWFHVLYAEPERERICHTGTYIETGERRQFTGLLDKNGVKIYEGDVVRYEGYEGSIDHAEVVWHQGFLAWMVDDHSGKGMIPLYDLVLEQTLNDDSGCSHCNEIEVIGNVHENPELVEVE